MFEKHKAIAQEISDVVIDNRSSVKSLELNFRDETSQNFANLSSKIFIKAGFHMIFKSLR